MQQLVIGIVLLAVGILLSLIYNRMRQGEGGTAAEMMDIREVSAHLKEGQSGIFTVRAPLQAEQPGTSAFDETKKAYFETRVLALEGKHQREIYSGKSEAKPFMQDAPGEEKLWIDIPSFGDNAELFPSHMDTAQPGTPLFGAVERLAHYQPGNEFQGYRVLEGCIRPGQQVLFTGTVRRRDGKLLAEAGVRAKSSFTYREPEESQCRQPLSTSAKIMLALGAVTVVAGAVLLINSLL